MKALDETARQALRAVLDLHHYALADVERLAVEAVLARHHGSVSRAARALGIGRTSLYRKLGRYRALDDAAQTATPRLRSEPPPERRP